MLHITVLSVYALFLCHVSACIAYGYRFNATTATWERHPAQSTTVRAFLKGLRQDKLASGDKVEQALAMHYEDLSAIHAVLDSTESGLDPFTKELMNVPLQVATFCG